MFGTDKITELRSKLEKDSVYQKINDTIREVKEQIEDNQETLKEVKDRKDKLNNIEDELESRTENYEEMMNRLLGVINE
ncbi:MAG: hypothetical protein ACLFPS_09100 [Clostridia bacterium]